MSSGKNYLPLVPAPMYTTRPPFRMRAVIRSITLAIFGIHLETAIGTDVSASFMIPIAQSDDP